MTAVGAGSRVALRPLAIRASDDDPEVFVAGRPDGGGFVELPAVGAEAIRLLGTGLPVAEVERRLADDDGPPDVAGLVTDIIDLGWVEAVDGQRLPDPVGPARVQLGWLRAAHLRWLFSRPVAACHAALLLAAAVTLVRRPDLLPGYRDFFWTDYVGLALLGNTLLFLAGGLVHELMHLAAARTLGLPARIGLGTRLSNLALQTDVSAAWAVPRRQRYRIYLAGIAWDTAAIGTAVLVRAYGDPGPLVSGVLAAYVVIAVVGLALQAQVYMRTDLYFVLMDLLRCGDLFHDGLRYARYLAGRAAAPLLRRRPAGPDPVGGLPRREARAVRIYAPLVVAGSAVALAAYAVIGVPVLVEATVRAVTALAALPSGGAAVPRAIDSGLLLVVEWGLLLVFIRTFRRSHQVWPRRATHDAERR